MFNHTISYPFYCPDIHPDIISSVKKRIFILFKKALEPHDIPDQISIEQKFNEILCSYDSLITRICFGYARTKTELDDLHQDALINIWQGLHNFRNESAIKTWIYRVTLNTCVSTLRKRQKEGTKESIDSLYDVVDESHEKRMMVLELHERISLLSQIDKAIILLWLEEFSYDAISDMTGLNRNTVATRIRRAKEKIIKL